MACYFGSDVQTKRRVLLRQNKQKAHSENHNQVRSAFDLVVASNVSRNFFYLVVTNGIKSLEDKEKKGLIYEILCDKSQISVDEFLQIEKDVHRTFFPFYHEAKALEQDVELNPDLEEADKQARLADAARLRLINEELRQRCQRILIAYSAVDKQVGYVQGFNSIVAALLYINFQSEKDFRETKPIRPEGIDFQPTFSEEEVFFMFYEFMHHLKWRNNFVNGMDDIQRMCNEFSQELKKSDPEMHKKFFHNDVSVLLIFRCHRWPTSLRFA